MKQGRVELRRLFGLAEGEFRVLGVGGELEPLEEHRMVDAILALGLPAQDTVADKQLQALPFTVEGGLEVVEAVDDMKGRPGRAFCFGPVLPLWQPTVEQDGPVRLVAESLGGGLALGPDDLALRFDRWGARRFLPA